MRGQAGASVAGRLMEARGADADVFVGLDVGGSSLKGARVSAAGEVLARLQEPTRKDSADALLAQLEAAVRALENGGCSRVGLGLPGIVDMRMGCLRSAPNLAVLNGLDVAAEVARRTTRPAFVENDANAAALAESWLGAGRGAETVLFLTLGTGVGGGIVVDGRVWGGRNGFAGEVGHIQVDPGGGPCGCGSWGCLETVVGVAGWVRRAREGMACCRSSLASYAELSPEVIVAEARDGDGVALDVVDGAARALGVGIAASLSLLNAGRVVIGGGVAQAGEFLLEKIVGETRRRTFPHVFEGTVFRLAELGADAGAIGAARVAMVSAAA